ncbi:hypothetical protein A2U01_0015317 [Trifolium medium]|uniref:Uncharacterized protein n=1 Tax=Trifolium medium TaxID=97028 RepID=A0A392N5C4_9FABA|nr:hypothetical protein [Trifolium medium]
MLWWWWEKYCQVQLEGHDGYRIGTARWDLSTGAQYVGVSHQCNMYSQGELEILRSFTYLEPSCY